MTTGMTSFGTSTPRVEDPDLLAGQARFVDDVQLPGTLTCAFVRSSLAHAHVRRIDTAAARALPGVHAVYTLANLMPHLTAERTPLGQSVRELVGLSSRKLRQDISPFILARDEVCYVGDPVAVVVAENRYVAEDAVGQVEVDFAPLPVASDCRSAMLGDAPPVHHKVSGNVLTEYTIEYGDCAQAFAQAAHRVSLSLRQHRGGAHPIEGRGVLASHDQVEGRTTVWTSTQSPHEIRLALVQLLGVDDDEIRVVTPDVGGGFGAKYLIYPEEVVVTLCARLLGRPVKWIEDRREHFLAAIQERDQYWELEAAFDGAAHLQAVRGTMINDQGAYTPQGINVSYNSATAVPGPYVLPSYRLHVFAVETNKVPTMPVRGAGYPQGTFAMERLLDRAADLMNLDRAEIRRRNLIPAADMPYETPLKTRAGTPVKYDSGDFPQCQATALAVIDYARRSQRQAQALSEGRYVGFGVANGTKGTGRGPFETGIVRIGRSGKVSVYTGAAAMGQSTKTMLAQIAADQFGVSPGDIRVVAGDTAHVPMGHGGFASRQAVNAGSSVHLASKAVRTKVLDVAAQLLDVAPERLELRDGYVRVTGASNLSIGLGDVAREAIGIPGYALPKGIEPGLEHTANFMPGGLAYSNSSHAVELEVDPWTGAVHLLRYVVASDCGRLINPMIVEGQILGGIVHGIGNTLFERMGYDESAQPLTTSLADYLLPGAVELPLMELTQHVTPSPLNPLGVKGVGECGVVPAAAAIVSAVEDALSPFGVHIDEVPISPAQIVAKIMSSGKFVELRASGARAEHARKPQ